MTYYFTACKCGGFADVKPTIEGDKAYCAFCKSNFMVNLKKVIE